MEYLHTKNNYIRVGLSVVVVVVIVVAVVHGTRDARDGELDVQKKAFKCSNIPHNRMRSQRHAMTIQTHLHSYKIGNETL